MSDSNAATQIVNEAYKVQKRIQELENQIDWILEGVSMIADGEATNVKEFAEHIIRSSKHITSCAASIASALPPPKPI